MNKYQEALDDLWNGCPNPKEQVKSKEILQELVDKETPMKPENLKEIVVFESITKRAWTCPKCKHEYVGNPKIEYCALCGQHIDWSEYDENC